VTDFSSHLKHLLYIVSYNVIPTMCNTCDTVTQHSIPDTGWNRCKRCAGDEWLADIAVRLLIASDVKFYKQLNCVHLCVLSPPGWEIWTRPHSVHQCNVLIQKNTQLSEIRVKCHHSLIASRVYHSKLHIHTMLHHFMINRFSGFLARTDIQTDRQTHRQTQERHQKEYLLHTAELACR